MVLVVLADALLLAAVAESDETLVLAEALAVESPILFAGLGEELVDPPHPASARHNAMQLTMMNRVRFISLLSL